MFLCTGAHHTDPGLFQKPDLSVKALGSRFSPCLSPSCFPHALLLRSVSAQASLSVALLGAVIEIPWAEGARGPTGGPGEAGVSQSLGSLHLQPSGFLGEALAAAPVSLVNEPLG